MKEYIITITSTRRITAAELADYATQSPWPFTVDQYKAAANEQNTLTVTSPDIKTAIEVRHVQ